MTQNNVTAAINFIDLATYTDLEAYLYGGVEACTYFIRAVKASNWFSFAAITLKTDNNAGFNSQFSATLNRSADYILNVWLRVRVPQLELDTTAGLKADASIRWTRNFMHNLISNCHLEFNNLILQEFDNIWLDMNYKFRVRGSKQVGDRNMIGDISSMTTPKFPGPAPGTLANVLGTGGWFNLPLPFYFAEDSGVSLPIAAIPFNDVKIYYTLRNWTDLLIINPGIMAGVAATSSHVIMTGTTAAPSIPSSDIQTFAHYATVHNDERQKMGLAPRDILVHQVQSSSEVAFDATVAGVSTNVDVRFSHAIRGLFWVVRNNTTVGEWSNYTTEPDYEGLDPITTSQLIYENTQKMSAGSDYTSLVAPYYWCEAIPDETGYHMYSYSLSTFNLDPMGSTNYSKLTNVTLTNVPSAAAVATTVAPFLDKDGVALPSAQTYRLHIKAINHNILRISGGSAGLPVL